LHVIKIYAVNLSSDSEKYSVPAMSEVTESQSIYSCSLFANSVSSSPDGCT